VILPLIDLNYFIKMLLPEDKREEKPPLVQTEFSEVTKMEKE
jgi:hypothetical protein